IPRPDAGSGAPSSASMSGEHTTSDQTMPSMVGPTPEQIRSHRVNSTLLGHQSPTVVGAGLESAPSSRAPVSPVPVSPVPVSPVPVSPVAVSNGAAARSHPHPTIGAASPRPAIAGPQRGGPSHNATLLGHAAPGGHRHSHAAPRSSTSQTMPSMQAVRSGAPVVAAAPTSGEDEDADPFGARTVEPVVLEDQRVTPHDSP